MPSDYAQLNASQLLDELDHVRIKISLLEERQPTPSAELLEAHAELRAILKLRTEHAMPARTPRPRNRRPGQSLNTSVIVNEAG